MPIPTKPPRGEPNEIISLRLLAYEQLAPAATAAPARPAYTVHDGHDHVVEPDVRRARGGDRLGPHLGERVGVVHDNASRD
jgi:hypothetical protein